VGISPLKEFLKSGVGRCQPVYKPRAIAVEYLLCHVFRLHPDYRYGTF